MIIECFSRAAYGWGWWHTGSLVWGWYQMHIALTLSASTSCTVHTLTSLCTGWSLTVTTNFSCTRRSVGVALTQGEFKKHDFKTFSWIGHTWRCNWFIWEMAKEKHAPSLKFNIYLPCTHFFWELSVFPGPHIGGGGGTQDLLLGAGTNCPLHWHFPPRHPAPFIPSQAFALDGAWQLLPISAAKEEV